MNGPGITRPVCYVDTMNRSPFTLYIVSLSSFLLSAWLILYGLELRFFGTILPPSGLLEFFTPPETLLRFVDGLGSAFNLGDLGWPLVVIGSSTLGSVAGLWKRQRWSIPSLVLFSALSLITLHWMNSLSILNLVLSRSPGLRKWLDGEDVS